MKKYILSILIFNFSGANALEWHTSKINMVYPQENGNFVLRFDEGTSNCENGSKFYSVDVGEYGVTEEGVKLLFSSAVAAAAQGTEVSIYWEPRDGQCYIKRFKVFY